MLWDHRMTLTNAATGPDPLTAPGNVPNDRIVELRKREPNTASSNRLIMGLHAPAGESVDVSVYALDAADLTEPPADRRWSLVFSGTVGGGGVLQSGLASGATGFVGGGLFYFRQTADTMTAPRELLLRATS